MTAVKIQEALHAWADTNELPNSDPEALKAHAKLIRTVEDSLNAIPEVVYVDTQIGSAGSTYFECVNSDHESNLASVVLRVSNHKAGRRGAEVAGDIVVGDSIDEIRLQLAKVAKRLKEEMAFRDEELKSNEGN